MKVLIDKSFEKDTDKISDKKLLNTIADCIEKIKLLGFIFENHSVEFIRFLHRSKIYDNFPD